MKKSLLTLLVALTTMVAQAQYKVGDIYNKGGVKGMVVVVDESGQHGLLLSLDESDKDWTADKALNLETAAFHEDDGAKNMDAIAKYIAENNKSWADFPVFAWARSLGEGWYIPAKEELLQVWTNLNGGDLKLDKKSKKTWKTYNKGMKSAKGDALFTKLSVIESGMNHVLMGMISSSESDGGKIWAVGVVGRLCIIDALPAPNAKIEADEIDKNNHSVTANMLSVRRKFATRAVHKF